jgi:hypothetical protein
MVGHMGTLRVQVTLPQTTFYYLYNGQGMQKTLPLCLSFAPSQLVTELFGSCLAWRVYFLGRKGP